MGNATGRQVPCGEGRSSSRTGKQGASVIANPPPSPFGAGGVQKGRRGRQPPNPFWIRETGLELRVLGRDHGTVKASGVGFGF